MNWKFWEWILPKYEHFYCRCQKLTIWWPAQMSPGYSGPPLCFHCGGEIIGSLELRRSGKQMVTLK